MSATETFRNAIKELGGQKAVASLIGRTQSTISAYVTGGTAPADVCMRLELETGGRFSAEDMRPDLADTFRKFRAAKPPASVRKTRRRAAA